MSSSIPTRYTVRHAGLGDLPGMLAVHHQSSNASHPFFDCLLPQSGEEAEFFMQAFRMGIEDAKCKTFVVVDCGPEDVGLTSTVFSTDLSSCGDGGGGENGEGFVSRHASIDATGRLQHGPLPLRLPLHLSPPFCSAYFTRKLLC
jgi:hypothetical protein